MIRKVQHSASSRDRSLAVSRVASTRASAAGSAFRRQAQIGDDDIAARRHPADFLDEQRPFGSGRLLQSPFENFDLLTAMPAALDFLFAVADSTHVGHLPVNGSAAD
jgi:hypothetical protein